MPEVTAIGLDCNTSQAVCECGSRSSFFGPTIVVSQVEMSGINFSLQFLEIKWQFLVIRIMVSIAPGQIILAEVHLCNN